MCCVCDASIHRVVAITYSPPFSLSLFHSASSSLASRRLAALLCTTLALASFAVATTNPACPTNIAQRQHWPASPAGTAVHAPCPAGSQGDMTRLCCGAGLHGATDVLGQACDTSVHGTWLAPSPTACHSLLLSKIAQFVAAHSDVAIDAPMALRLLRTVADALEAAGGALGTADVAHARAILDATLGPMSDLTASTMAVEHLVDLANVTANVASGLLRAHAASPDLVTLLVARLVPLQDAVAGHGLGAARMTTDTLILDAAAPTADGSATDSGDKDCNWHAQWPSAQLADEMEEAGMDLYAPRAQVSLPCARAAGWPAPSSDKPLAARQDFFALVVSPLAIAQVAPHRAVLASDQLILMHAPSSAVVDLRFPVSMGASLRLGLRMLLRQTHSNFADTPADIALLGVTLQGNLHVHFEFALPAVNDARNTTGGFQPRLAALTIPARISCRQRIGVDVYDKLASAPQWTEAGCELVSVAAWPDGVHCRCSSSLTLSMRGSSAAAIDGSAATAAAPPTAFGAFLELAGGDDAGAGVGADSGSSAERRYHLSGADARLITLVLLSMVGLVSLLTLFGLAWLWRSAPLTSQQQVMINVCLSLCIAAGLHAAMVEGRATTPATVAAAACTATGALISYAFVATVVWQMGLLVAHAMRYWRPLTPPECLLPLMSLVCWLLPVGPILVAALLPPPLDDGDEVQAQCWRPLPTTLDVTRGDAAALLAPAALMAIAFVAGIVLMAVLLCATRLPAAPVFVAGGTLLATVCAAALLAVGVAEEAAAPEAACVGALLLLCEACVLFHRFCLRDTEVYDVLREAPLGFMLPERKRTPYKMRLESPLRHGGGRSGADSPGNFLHYVSRSNNGSRTSLFTSATTRSNSSPMLIVPRLAYQGSTPSPSTYASPSDEARASEAAKHPGVANMAGQLAVAAAQVVRERQGRTSAAAEAAQEEADFACISSRTFETMYGTSSVSCLVADGADSVMSTSYFDEGRLGENRSGRGLPAGMPAPLLIPRPSLAAEQALYPVSPAPLTVSNGPGSHDGRSPAEEYGPGHASPRQNPFNTTSGASRPVIPVPLKATATATDAVASPPTSTRMNVAAQSAARMQSCDVLLSPTKAASWRASQRAMAALDALENAAAQAAAVARGATSNPSSPKRAPLQRARSSPYFTLSSQGTLTPSRGEEDVPEVAQLRGRTVSGGAYE